MVVFFVFGARCLADWGRLWHFCRMDRIHIYLSSVMAMALLSSSAFAEDAGAVLKLRGSARENSTRIILEGTGTPSYKAAATATSLTLTFPKPVQLKAEGEAVSALPRIAAFSSPSPLTVEIDVAKGQTLRHFAMGNKIIVDITGNPPAPETKHQIQAPKVQEKPHEPKAEEPQSLITALAAKEPPESAKATETPDAQQPAAGVSPPAVENKLSVEGSPPVPAVAPTYVAGVTSTTTVPLAAFERNGYLWIVEGKEDVAISPQLEGNTNGNLAGFEPVDAKGVSAFRLKLPASYRFIGEGGGLVWKVRMAENFKEEPRSIVLTREFPADKPGGGSLIWPAHSGDKVADVTDPDTGEIIKVVLVNQAKSKSGDAQDFAEVTLLYAPIGLAAVPKTDDVTLENTGEEIEITRPQGLKISPAKDIPAPVQDKTPEPLETKQGGKISRIFDFAAASDVKIAQLSEQQRVILSGLKDQTESNQAENLILLGRMLLAHNYAPEALGYFSLAQQYLPDIEDNPELRGYRGAAEALSGQYKEAFTDLSVPLLEHVDEIKYWKAFALAGLDDWQQAAKKLPDDPAMLESYPDSIRNAMGVVLVEIALREGNSPKAEKYLAVLEAKKRTMDAPRKAALEYLQGELGRQKGDNESAKETWTDLEKSNDDLYRSKARFALTTLKYGLKDITIDKAIDNLEGLRYAWRGDLLETAINFNLAKLYLEKNDPIKALSLMKGAMMLSPNSEQGKMISATMHDVFANVFKPENIKKISPVDAMTLYSEFSDLAPTGEEGDKLSRQLAERLVDADLLPRATAMLAQQVDGEGRLKGLEGTSVALRLASLQLLDSKPDMALLSLGKAETYLKGLTNEEIEGPRRDIGILRAKAYSALGKPETAYNAIAMLPQSLDILKLRSEIAWKAKRWQDAADALEQLILAENISLTRPLNEYQADLIMNWAVSLYLADNRYVLANLRERYGDAMLQTSKAKKFEVITRPRQSSLLTDKDTVNSIINEIEIFKGFSDTVQPSKEATPPQVINPATGAAKQPLPEALKSAPAGIQMDEVLAD